MVELESMQIFFTVNSSHSFCDISSGGRRAAGGWVEEREVGEGATRGTNTPEGDSF